MSPDFVMGSSVQLIEVMCFLNLSVDQFQLLTGNKVTYYPRLFGHYRDISDLLGLGLRFPPNDQTDQVTCNKTLVVY